ncbi:MBL fold metallo-hydrolase [Yimella radicis]
MTEVVWTGGAVSDRSAVILCPNPGPMTLEGTNTWVLHSTSTDEVIVVDPGPLDEDHLTAIENYVEQIGARVALTLVTHGHFDHDEGVPLWVERTGSPVRGAGRGESFEDGDRISSGDIDLRVLVTPGHTKDSVSFAWDEERLLLTGDTVLGRGTSIVAHPDGNLTSYLASLEALYAAASEGGSLLAPGHGPATTDAAAVIDFYRKHRAERLEQVRAALKDSDPNTEDLAQAIVELVYADVSKDVWPAAKATVQAQLEYLELQR